MTLTETTLAETTLTITPRADVSLAGMRLDLAEAARAASERD
jgi:hypothetical protein